MDNLFVVLCGPGRRSPVRGTTAVVATHPTRRSLASEGWVLIQNKARGRLRVKYDGYSGHLEEARKDAIHHGLRPTDSEFELHMAEYLQDRGILEPSSREELIAVLCEEGFEILENVQAFTLAG